MKIFWITYGIVLAAYILFSYFWLKKYKTLSRELKLKVWLVSFAITFIALVIAGVLYTASFWGTVKVCLLTGIPSATIAWTFTKCMLGLLLYGDPLYMSDKWPDKQIIQVANNKYLWFVTEIIIIVVTQGLFYYIKRQKK